jgi:uncharacterized protein (DUF1697 family)
MALVVFLKGVNVGGHKTFRPSVLARHLVRLGVINIGAAGTFVVQKPISQAMLRREFQRRLPFTTEARICSGNEILRQVSEDAYRCEGCRPDTVRFVGILGKRPRRLPPLPLSLPSPDDWLVRLVAVRGRFAFGVYRRTMRTIACLGQLEKHIGASMTCRNWNTISTLLEILRSRARK